GELLAKLNGFVYGLGLETVGYVTNGDSDDWMYGDQGIFSMTPEIGDPEDGFYPLPERIIPLCQSMLNMNLLAARLVNSLVEITDESPKYIKAGVNPLDLEFNRYGLLPGNVEISFNPLSPHILTVPEPIQLDMVQFEPHLRNLTFTVDDQIPYGTSVKIEIVCKQGEYTFRDTLTKTRTDFTTLIADEANDLSQWENEDSAQWGLTSSQYKSGPTAITDSPLGEYEPNSNSPLVLLPSVDLTKSTAAYAQFWAKWDIEDFYDYVVFQASTDGENWQNLCGEQSRFGSLFQLYEEPLYDGKQARWVFETTDLSSYIGHLVRLRFLLVSDGYVNKDGFYFDDFKVISIDQKQVGTTDVTSSIIQASPNPVNGLFTIQVPDVQHAQLSVFNSLGESIYHNPVESNQPRNIDTQSWPAGLYYFTLTADGRSFHHGTVSVVH
ncbi:MAG TPA: T9SS type A sorting domain-containing protein, partial [Saprospiraceae bacterium]|nr:T9SS type A sorting domain-containing protein [Saprospiraceae bacterium]